MQRDPLDKFLQDTLSEFESPLDTDQVWKDIHAQVPRRSGKRKVYAFPMLILLIGVLLGWWLEKDESLRFLGNGSLSQESTKLHKDTLSPSPSVHTQKVLPNPSSIKQEESVAFPSSIISSNPKVVSLDWQTPEGIYNDSTDIKPIRINEPFSHFRRPIIPHKVEIVSAGNQGKDPYPAPDLSPLKGLNQPQSARKWEVKTSLVSGHSFYAQKYGSPTRPNSSHTHSVRGLEFLGIDQTIGFRMASGWKVGTGLSLQLLNEKFSFESQKIELQSAENQKVGFRLQGVGDTLFFLDELAFTRLERRNVQHFNQYLFLDLPVFVSYQIQRGKIRWELEGGALHNIIFQAKGRWFKR